MQPGTPRRRWSRIFRPDARTEVEDELSFHIERRVQDNIARGMDAEAARAAAYERLGDLQHVRTECTQLLQAERRAEARSDFMKMSWLDFKLGFRLLRRYPGLTLVGGLAMAFAIAVGAGAFEVVKQLVDPVLPLPDGDRIVAVRTRDLTQGDYRAQTVRDLVSWRETLTSIEELSAFRTLDRNLTIGDGVPEPVQLAEMSASGFRVTRVSPLLGRALVEADERVGAPAVIVIGYELWQNRFDADPRVLGRAVRIGRVPATIVGVMPEGFAFPVAHRLWLPLRMDAADSTSAAGPELRLFGRLAHSASLESAQAELRAVAARSPAAAAAVPEQLRPVVHPFARAFGSISLDVPPELRPIFYAINLFFVVLLLLICANVALLMFARAATREGEIVVRNALGASRGRIVTQLFAEALVLGSAAAVVGLALATVPLRAFRRVYELESGGQLPFWYDASLSPATAVYAVALLLLAAAVAGVLPALKMTGRRVEARLRQLAAGGGGLRFGRLWTTVIVVQVALTVAFPAAAFFVRSHVVGAQNLDPGFPATQYLSTRLELDRDAAFAADLSATEAAAWFDATVHELTRRLAADPAVAGVTLTDQLPGTGHHPRRIEVENDANARPDTAVYYRVANASIDLDYFTVLGARVHSGRTFHSADREAGARTVIVNESFVRRVLGGRNPLGQRIRYVDVALDERPWYEIVGVVKNLGIVIEGPADPGIYHALPAGTFPVHLAIHVRQDPTSFAPRLRALAAAVEPGLRLYDVLPMDEVGSSMWLEFNFLFKLLAAVSGIALLLSLAGIYAVTSFTVARRTREIGIRVALGADARRVLTTIFARPLLQVGIGVVAGGCLTAALAYGLMRGALDARGTALMVAYAALMMGVCMLACVVPTRRVLRIEPTEALRQE
jgi:putative ABC transport system permease protein